MDTLTIDSAAMATRAPCAVVTTAADGARAGSVVRFHTQCGVAPIRHAVWVPTGGHTYAVARRATHVAIHLVDGCATGRAELPTTPGELDDDWFDRHPWDAGPGGVPILGSLANPLVLRLVAAPHAPGDFACLVGELVDGGTRPADPAGDLAPRLAAMSAEERRQFVNAAIGAGHAIDVATARAVH